MNRTTLDLQKALSALGYDPGPSDGKLGPKTRAATRAFQRDNRLTDDGIAGPKTWAAIEVAAFRSGTGYLNPAEFAKWAPDALPQTLEALEAAIRAYPALADPKVLDDWLGQMWVESKGFSTMVENLNYSVAGLRATFGRHRISDAECEAYGRKPGRPANQPAIANIVYGGEWGRKNLGNTEPTDGWDFRGSGFKQITGRANTEASGFTAVELRTDVFKAALAAAQFFVSHGCVPFAQRGDITGVTKKVNGGTNGLAERAAKTASAQKVILR
jgi:putative chitinase